SVSKFLSLSKSSFSKSSVSNKDCLSKDWCFCKERVSKDWCFCKERVSKDWCSAKRMSDGVLYNDERDWNGFWNSGLRKNDPQARRRRTSSRNASGVNPQS